VKTPAENIPGEESGRDIFAAAPGLELAARLFDSLVDIVFCIKDRAGRYVAANAAFAQRLGRRGRRDLLGRTARDLFPAPLAAVYEAEDAEVLATGRGIADKLELVFNIDGSLGWYLASKEPIADSAGRVLGIVGISRDLRLHEKEAPRIVGVADAIARIRREFHRPLRIEALARGTGLSLDTFERRFRKAVGITAREFLLRVRIEEAVYRLRSGSMPLAKIAQACGFYDQSSFTRHFRRAVGFTPSNYRRVVRGD
jgi:PAS domain S-box-containing protein